ncbi:MAG: O-Antigen ligase [Candidatus Scalindua rubra]|uniref:O-Antigen ligase n=1 Tax=Candidatus Scalindua rubra TaxID=1872076 RepID=A0A1E3X513_9BACT|nr:MAG: O-Antigen ligase [Candidatus Scalindua rubra]
MVLRSLSLQFFISFLGALVFLNRFQRLGFDVIRNLLISLCLVSIGMAMVGLLNLFIGTEVSTSAIEGRNAILGGGPIVFSRIVGLSIIILVVFFKKLRELIPTIPLVALIILLLTAQISTLSKGPLLSLFVTIAVMILFFGRQTQRTKLVRNIVFVMVVGSFIVSLMFYLDMTERYFLDPFSDISYVSYGRRIQHYQGSMAAFFHSPVLGIGLGDFKAFGHGFDYPHNIFLETLAELGIIGIIVLTAIIIGFFSLMKRLIRIEQDKTSSLEIKALLFVTLYMFF